MLAFLQHTEREVSAFVSISHLLLLRDPQWPPVLFIISTETTLSVLLEGTEKHIS